MYIIVVNNDLIINSPLDRFYVSENLELTVQLCAFLTICLLDYYKCKDFTKAKYLYQDKKYLELRKIFTENFPAELLKICPCRGPIFSNEAQLRIEGI
jgi:hypothetical protein